MKRYVRWLSVLFVLCVFLHGASAHAAYGNPLIGTWSLQTPQYREVISFNNNQFRIVQGNNTSSWLVLEGYYQIQGNLIRLNNIQGQFSTNGYQLQIYMEDGKGGTYQRVQ